jgi:hypothetical protein
MRLDENAAAFGLFHLAFANLTQQLAVAVFFLRRLNEPDLKFEKVFRIEFSRLREALLTQLTQFDDQQGLDMDLQYLRHRCDQMAALANWRNDRAHPRVQFDEHGMAIYNWRTGQRLSINVEECVQQIEMAVACAVDLDHFVGSIIRTLESQKEMEALLAEAWENLEI